MIHCICMLILVLDLQLTTTTLIFISRMRKQLFPFKKETHSCKKIKNDKCIKTTEEIFRLLEAYQNAVTNGDALGQKEIIESLAAYVLSPSKLARVLELSILQQVYAIFRNHRAGVTFVPPIPPQSSLQPEDGRKQVSFSSSAQKPGDVAEEKSQNKCQNNRHLNKKLMKRKNKEREQSCGG